MFAKIVEQKIQLWMFVVCDVPVVAEDELPEFGYCEWPDHPLVGEVPIPMYQELFKLYYEHLPSVS